MSQEVPGFARKTHDIYAVRQREGSEVTLDLVGAVLRTDLGKHLDIFFDEIEILDAVLLACPIGLSLNDMIDLLWRITR